MHELADRDDVIALALHVDYWDYIGWKDEYADPAYTARQKAYAVEAGRRSIYTPQMIINGMDDVVGARAMQLADLIMKHKAVPAKITLKIARDGKNVVIRADAVEEATGAVMVVQLVRYQHERTAHIMRGENAGRHMTYRNVVDGWTVLGEWDGRKPLEMKAEASDDRPAVVLIQSEKTGPIVAAAKVD